MNVYTFDNAAKKELIARAQRYQVCAKSRSYLHEREKTAGRFIDRRANIIDSYCLTLCQLIY